MAQSTIEKMALVLIDLAETNNKILENIKILTTRLDALESKNAK